MLFSRVFLEFEDRRRLNLKRVGNWRCRQVIVEVCARACVCGGGGRASSARPCLSLGNYFLYHNLYCLLNFDFHLLRAPVNARVFAQYVINKLFLGLSYDVYGAIKCYLISYWVAFMNVATSYKYNAQGAEFYKYPYIDILRRLLILILSDDESLACGVTGMRV